MGQRIECAWCLLLLVVVLGWWCDGARRAAGASYQTCTVGAVDCMPREALLAAAGAQGADCGEQRGMGRRIEKARRCAGVLVSLYILFQRAYGTRHRAPQVQYKS